MSEAALAPPLSQLAHQVAVRTRHRRLNPLEALESGFALFRSTFAQEAWRYYIGAVPLVLCFIPMWVVNGQIQLSDAALLTEAALLAGAYLLRVWMAGSYMQCVRERAFRTPTTRPVDPPMRAAAAGRLLLWKVMLSAGALVALPSVAGTSWLYSASQFASLETQEDGAERHSFSGCLALASQWFGGGFILFLMLVPLWIAALLNGLILAIIFPQLLHSILGVNTLLSTRMGIYALVESSAFSLSLFAAAWLALDPVVKCTFVIVYQNLRSRREGDDLRGILAQFPREQQKKARMIASGAAYGRVMTGALFLLAAFLFSISLTATAKAAPVPPARSATMLGSYTREARIQKLRQAMDRESRRAVYRWHDARHPRPPSWIEKVLSKIEHAIDIAWDALWSFLRKLWPSALTLSHGDENHRARQLKDVRLWLTVIATLTLAAAAVLFWLRRRPEAVHHAMPQEVAPLPDLGDDAAASERSEDEWFALASRLEDEGELRLALRAAYFALLAGLAQREWLTIRRDRTNREYLNEFTRRWHRRPQASVEARADIPEKLRGSLRQFDCVWYGSHVLTPEAVSGYCHDQREFLSHV